MKRYRDKLGNIYFFSRSPKHWYNVKKWGAEGDKRTDDTDAIQRVINSITGSTLYFPGPGTYMVRHNGYSEYTALHLAKDGVTVQLDDDAEIKMITNASEYYSILAVNADDITIKGGAFTGDRDTHTGGTGEYGYGISFYDCKHVLIDGVKCQDCWGDGLMIDGTDETTIQDVTIQNCILDHNRRQGITVLCLDGGLFDNNECMNHDGTSPMSGIDLEPYQASGHIHNVIVSNNDCHDNVGGGIVAGGSAGEISDITISGNTVTGNGTGMWVDSVTRYDMKDNIFGTNADGAIGLYNGRDCEISGNQITDGIGFGIAIAKTYGTSNHCENCLIDSNEITGTVDGGSWGGGGAGVIIQGASHDIIVSNNTMDTNEGPAIVNWQAGTGNIYTGNDFIDTAPVTTLDHFISMGGNVAGSAGAHIYDNTYTVTGDLSGWSKAIGIDSAYEIPLIEETITDFVPPSGKVDPDSTVIDGIWTWTVDVTGLIWSKTIVGATLGSYYPNYHPETVSVDGWARQTYGTGSGETFATIQAAAGSDANSENDGQDYNDVSISSDTGSGNYYILRRSIFLFDTSALSGKTIVAASFSVHGMVKENALGWSGSRMALALVSSAPASDTAIASGDYDSLGSTRYADDIPYSSWNAEGRTEWDLNAAGLAAINKTGVTKLGLRIAADLDNDPGAWLSAVSSYIKFYYSEYGDHTTYAPRLSVYYTG